MKYGYSRISTIEQDLHSQMKILEAENCDYIYTEKFTGTQMDRKEFNKLLDVLEVFEAVLKSLENFSVWV